MTDVDTLPTDSVGYQLRERIRLMQLEIEFYRSGRNRMLSKLEKYAKHLEGWEYNTDGEEGDCTCGLFPLTGAAYQE